jgi:dolichol-phosphate mannosyltransferase
MKTIVQYIKENVLNFKILKFGIVGGSGVVVNMGLLYILTAYFNMDYKIASIFAIEMSIITNFLLNNYWTWQDQRHKNFWLKLMQYNISVGIAAILANWLLLIFLTEVVGIYYMISNLIGIAVGTALNFVINDLWTFRAKNKPDVSEPAE